MIRNSFTMRSLAVLLALAVAAPAASQQTAADSARVYDLHEVEVLPWPQNVADFTAALHSAYPAHLRSTGVGGTVQVAFIVGPDGAPGDVRVISTPDSSFSAPSVQAISLLRFTPAQVQGRAVAVRVEQPITWQSEAAPATGSDVASRPVIRRSGASSTGDETAAPARATKPIRTPGDSINGYELSTVERLPRLVNGTVFGRALQREYPPYLRDARVAATVIARFRVEVDGSVSQATITESSDERFNEPTLRAIAVQRFRPAQVNGRPVRVWVDQPIRWTVEGPDWTAAPGYERDRGRFTAPPNPCSQC
jgi:TonB family protein